MSSSPQGDLIIQPQTGQVKDFTIIFEVKLSVSNQSPTSSLLGFDCSLAVKTPLVQRLIVS
jgi:hypothetical protein